MVGLSVVTDSGYFHQESGGQATEYFQEGGQAPSHWSGTLAEKMGLSGPVSRDDVDRFAGRDPEKLKEMRDAKVANKIDEMRKENPLAPEADLARRADEAVGKDRIGINISYSAPKSVSLAYGQGDARMRQDMQDAHRAGVEAANKHIEQNVAWTRSGKAGKEDVPATGLAIASYEHSHSRYGDDNLHTHSVILNSVERGSDGKLTALNPKEIYREQKNIDQIYKSAMAQALQERGYGVEMTDQHGNFRLSGISENWEKSFSNGQKAIDNKVNQLREKYPRASDAELREIAAKECRPAKTVLNREDQMKRDDATWREAGASREEMRESIKNAMVKSKAVSEEKVENYLRQAAEIKHENQSTISKTDLYATAARLSLAGATRGERAISSKDLDKAYGKLRDEGYFRDIGHGQVTTSEMQKIERGIVNHVREAKGTVKSISSNKEIDKAIADHEKQAGYKMTAGQQDAIRAVLKTTDRVIGIQGDAGAGKTTSFAVAGGELRKAGHTVIGLAPTGKAADEMAKTLGNGRTIDSFLGAYERGDIKVVENKTKQDKAYSALASKFDSKDWSKKAIIGKQTGQSEYLEFMSKIAGQPVSERCFHGENGTQIIVSKGKGILGNSLSNKIDVYTRDKEGKITHTVHRDFLPGTAWGKLSTTKEYAAPENTLQRGKATILVDETSMVGSKQMSKLLGVAQEIGSRVVLVGDVKQHTAVSAGKIFSDLQKNGMATTRMNESIRQNKGEYREAVKALSEKQFAKAEGYLRANTTEVRERNKTDAVRAEYAKGNYQSTHVCVSTNKEKSDLNNALRTDLRDRGIVGKDEHKLTARESKNLGAEAKRYAYNYQVGDKVITSSEVSKSIGNREKGNEYSVKAVDYKNNTITLADMKGKTYQVDCRKHGKDFAVYHEREMSVAVGDKVMTTKNDKGLDVKNGQMWIVNSIDSKGNMTLEGKDGEKRNIRGGQYNYIDYGYATTSHKAQGLTTEKVISVAGDKTDFNKEYTNVTRGKTEVKIITTDKEGYFASMRQEQIKASTIDTPESRKKEQEKGLQEGKEQQKEQATKHEKDYARGR